MITMSDLVKNHRGVSAFPVVIFLSLFLFLAFGPFSKTAARLLGPVVEHATRVGNSILTWLL